VQNSFKIYKNIPLAAFYGAFAWTVYAIVECLFSSILPWLIKPSHLYIPVHWAFTGLLFLFYPFCGLILGGLAGLCADLLSKRFRAIEKVEACILSPAFGTFTLVLAYLANFIINRPESLYSHSLPLLFGGIFLIFALVLTLLQHRLFNRFQFFINPWTVSFLVLGVPWIFRELFGHASFPFKAMAAVTYFFIILAATFFIKRTAHGPRLRKQTLSGLAATAKPMLVLLPFAFALFVISFYLKQEPLVQTQHSQSSPLASNRPNVILIVMDTVRADHLSLYGYEIDTSPKLKELSKEATLYMRAIAPSDMTLPTHASIFTGISAKRHHAHLDRPPFGLGRPLGDNFVTLAEVLFQSGYATLAVVSNHAYVSEEFGLAQGFEYFDQRAPTPFFSNLAFYHLRQSVCEVASLFTSPHRSGTGYRSAGEINNVVFSLLNGRPKRDKPFFLFINYMDAHWPYIPPSPFDRLLPGKDFKFTTKRYTGLVAEVMKLERKVTKKERNHLVSQYDGGIAYLDSEIGNLFTKLKELNLFENTLLIITSDHGESFGRRNFVGHIVSAYQDQIHVPLIIKHPNTNDRALVQNFVSLVDLVPTVLAVLGYPIPDNLDGKSLLTRPSENSRPIIAESYPGSFLWNLHPRFHRQERAIFQGPYKLIVSTAGKRELYDLSDDPNEKMDLFGENSEIGKKLETKMSQWAKSAESAEIEAASASKLDTETINRLKSLGYVR
jgi:arylsulfatase A-like enzyme